MATLPLRVKETFLRLKKEYPFYVALTKINDKFYVYRHSSRWDKHTKKIKSVSEYLGKITSDGEFIRKIQSNKPINEPPSSLRQEPPEKLDPIEIKFLKILSMNARADLSHLGKKYLKLKPAAVFYRVKQIEQKYNIKYISEINTEKLGFREFLISVKFVSDRPKTDELKKVISAEPMIQLAAMTKGDFDVVLYALARTTEELKDVLIRLRTGPLGKYDSIWNGLPIYKSFGFIPLKNEFIEALKGSLLVREYAVLKELNNNSTMDFREIDKKYGFDEGRSAYTYHKLLQNGTLERATINMQNTRVKYTGILFIWKINSDKFAKNKMKSLFDLVEQTGNTMDKYSFAADTVDPDGVLRIVPMLEEGSLDRILDKLFALDLGIKITTNVITELLTGSFCYRLFDTSYSLQQKALERDYGVKAGEKIDYYETGRKKVKIPNKNIRFTPIEEDDYRNLSSSFRINSSAAIIST